MFCSECGSRTEEGSSFCSNCGAKILDGSRDFYEPGLPAKRPTGLLLVIINTAIGGVWSLLSAVWILSVSGLFVPPSAKFASVLGGLMGIPAIPCIYGLWSYSKWGLTLAMVLYTVSIPISILNFFIAVSISEAVVVTVGVTLGLLIGVTIAILILRYLSRPEIKRLFR